MAGIPHDQVHPDTMAAIMADIASDPFLKEHFAVIKVELPEPTPPLVDCPECGHGMDEAPGSTCTDCGYVSSEPDETPWRDMAGYDPIDHQSNLDAGRPGQ